MESLLKEAFTKPVQNGTRRRRSQNYSMLASDNTKCPKLDTTLKFQTVLDAVGPLTNILKMHQKGSLSNKTTVDVVKQAMRFLGNASSAILAKRRRRVADYLNKDLQDLRPLIEVEEHFQDALSFLFGKDFERVARDHMESVKSITKLSAARRGAPNPPFFGKAAPTIRQLVEVVDHSEKAVAEEVDIERTAA